MIVGQSWKESESGSYMYLLKKKLNSKWMMHVWISSSFISLHTFLIWSFILKIFNFRAYKDTVSRNTVSQKTNRRNRRLVSDAKIVPAREKTKKCSNIPCLLFLLIINVKHSADHHHWTHGDASGVFGLCITSVCITPAHSIISSHISHTAAKHRDSHDNSVLSFSDACVWSEGSEITLSRSVILRTFRFKD